MSFLAVVLGVGGTAGPGADPVPAADLATAGPGPSPTLGPVPAPKAARHAGASPSPNRLPGPVRSPSQSLAPGVPLRDQTKGPNRDLDQEADPSLRRLMELRRNREI